MNKTQLLQDIASNVYTNTQKRIKGNTVRDRFNNIVNSVLIVADDANVRYAAVTGGRINVSLVNSATPAGKYLRDDGTWQEVGAGSETDPIFTASPAATILTTDIDAWDEAYTWGNHASAGYIVPTGTANAGKFLSSSGSWDYVNSDYVDGLSASLASKFDVPGGTNSQYIRGDGSLASFPSFAVVSISGSYNDLIDRPTLGTLSSISPTGTPNASTFLKYDGTTYSWAAPSGGGSPGGSTTQIQFNNLGSFAGDSSFTWDNTNKRLSIGTGTQSFARDLMIARDVNDFIGFSVTNNSTGAAALETFNFGQNVNEFISFAHYNTGFTGNYTGTSISFASSARLSKTSGGNANGGAMVIGGTPILCLVGIAGTNYGTRLDANGLRIDTLSNLHTSNTSGRIIQAGNLQFTTGNVLNIANSAGVLQVNGTQVISSRKTGWVAATGTATRTTYVTSSVTLPQLAERVKALIDDLISHGIIGA
jgi:hypothetical protein